MTNRILIGQKIVVSKPGFNAADPALADANKVFDSDWGYNAALLFSGSVLFTGSPPFTISFPVTLNYVPAAYVWSTDKRSSGGGGNDFRLVGDTGVNGYQIYADRIVLNYSTVAPSNFFYMVFAL